MKINIDMSLEEVEFWKIPCGECFMFDNDFYIKCSNTHNKQIEKSVNLKTGELADFHQTKNKVIPVKGKVIIENKF